MAKYGHGHKWHKPTGDQSVADTLAERKTSVLTKLDRGVNGEESERDSRNIKRTLTIGAISAAAAVGLPVLAAAVDKTGDIQEQRINQDMNTPQQQGLIGDYQERQLPANPADMIVSVPNQPTVPDK